MSLPHVPEARSFYQSAKQRFEDASFLLEADRTTGAIYLAGYSVECILKALILCTVPPGQRSAIRESFRGGKAHSFDWLKELYSENGGPALPSSIARSFSLVSTWSIDLRYKAGTSKRRDAEAFLKAAHEIIEWADERL